MSFVKIIAGCLILIPLAGCRTISYTSPEGRNVDIKVFGFDTKIGKLEAKSPEGVSITLENFDTQAKAMDAVNSAIQRIPVPPIVP